MKNKVHEIATELNIKTNDLLAFLKHHGQAIKSPNQILNDEQVSLARSFSPIEVIAEKELETIYLSGVKTHSRDKVEAVCVKMLSDFSKAEVIFSKEFPNKAQALMEVEYINDRLDTGALK